MDSGEGQQFKDLYKINTLPSVAVLDPRTGELMVEWNHKDSPTYERLLKEFVAACSWGDDAVVPDTAEAKPSESRKRKLVIHHLFLNIHILVIFYIIIYRRLSKTLVNLVRIPSLTAVLVNSKELFLLYLKRLALHQRMRSGGSI